MCVLFLVCFSVFEVFRVFDLCFSVSVFVCTVSKMMSYYSWWLHDALLSGRV